MGLAMTNPALSQSARQKNVSNMLASLRIEKLSPSESLKPSLQAYVDGQKTTTDLRSRVVKSHAGHSVARFTRRQRLAAGVGLTKSSTTNYAAMANGTISFEMIFALCFSATLKS